MIFYHVLSFFSPPFQDIFFPRTYSKAEAMVVLSRPSPFLTDTGTLSLLKANPTCPPLRKSTCQSSGCYLG